MYQRECSFGLQSISSRCLDLINRAFSSLMLLCLLLDQLLVADLVRFSLFRWIYDQQNWRLWQPHYSVLRLCICLNRYRLSRLHPFRLKFLPHYILAMDSFVLWRCNDAWVDWHYDDFCLALSESVWKLYRVDYQEYFRILSISFCLWIVQYSAGRSSRYKVFDVLGVMGPDSASLRKYSQISTVKKVKKS